MNITRKTSITKTKNTLIAATVLSVIVIAGATATTTSSILFPKAFAQQQEQQPMQNTNTAAVGTTNATSPMTNSSTATSSSAGGSSVLSGIIASIQQNNAGAPQWVAAGSWTLVTDKPLFGGAAGGSPPTVNNFSAVVDMVSFANGTMFHTHHFYNFRDGMVSYAANNATNINGTMTITNEEGTTENVVAYLHFQNNFMSVWVDPGQINNHFGPTPINGMILSPQKLEEIRSAEAPQLQPQSMQNTTSSTSGPSSMPMI